LRAKMASLQLDCVDIERKQNVTLPLGTTDKLLIKRSTLGITSPVYKGSKESSQNKSNCSAVQCEIIFYISYIENHHNILLYYLPEEASSSEH